MNRPFGGSSERFFGVQWRLLLTHVEVALGAALVSAIAVGLAVQRGASIPAVVGWGLLAVLGSVVGGAAVALRFSRRLKSRLRETGRFASALARGDYRSRVLPGAPDEIGQLEGELNLMAENLEAAITELRELAERNRLLAQEAGSLAALEERTRLARDLHDTVNQQVFSLSMQAAAARRRLEGAGADPVKVGEVGTALADVEELARSAHRQIRELILQLRPTTLEEQGLGPALEEYARNFADEQGLKCHCQVAFMGRFDRSAEEALFRMAQEALNNVAKHAEATTVEVGLELLPGSPRLVSLTIRDNGRGFDQSGPVRATALGLRGLRERATSIGARARIDSTPGQGTTVRVGYPLG